MEELRSSPLLGELHRSVLRKSRTSKRKARKKITQDAPMNCQIESDLEFNWNGHDSHGPGKRFRQDSDSPNFSDLPDISSAREPSEQCPETNSHRRSLRIAARPDFVVAQEERTPLPKKKIPGCGMAYDDIKHHILTSVAEVGLMDQQCRHCNAFKYKGEPPCMCCGGGKNQLPELPELGEPLRSLLYNQDAQSKHFFQNIRAYNSCFAFISLGGESLNIGGWSTYKIQGTVYHSAGSLLPADGKDPRYLQVYFIQSELDQARRRILNNPVCKK